MAPSAGHNARPTAPRHQRRYQRHAAGIDQPDLCATASADSGTTRAGRSELSARVGAVGDGAVPYGGDSDDSAVVSQLIDDPVGTDPQ